MEMAHLGRILVILFSLLLAYKWAFKKTPQLDGVEDATMFRLSYAAILMRGVGYVAFDMLRLFPGETLK